MCPLSREMIVVSASATTPPESARAFVPPHRAKAQNESPPNVVTMGSEARQTTPGQN